MGFPRALEFLLLGLEVGDPALDLRALARHGDDPYASKPCRFWRFSLPRLLDRFGGLGARGGGRSGSRGPCRGDTFHKRQRLFDQLVALTHPMLHHAYPKARKLFTEVEAKINEIAPGRTRSLPRVAGKPQRAHADPAARPCVLNEDWLPLRKSPHGIAIISTIVFIQLRGAVIGFQRPL